MSSKRAKGSVGGGEAGKKAKTTPDAGEKSVSEKSQATRTCRNPFEKSKSKQTEFFVREVKDKRMTKNGPEFLIGWRDFPLERDDTWEPISNLTGSEHMICEFQKQHALDYEMKTAAVLKQVADRKKAMNEKNASTALDKTADDIQEARDDNACDDAEEEDDEEEEHGEGRAASGVQRKRRQERSFYFTTEAVKRMHSKEGGILTAMCQVGGHVECKKTITMPNGDTQGVLQHFGRCHPALNLKIRALNLTPSAAKNPPNFMTLLNQDVPEVVARQNPIIQSLDRALTRGDKLFTELNAYMRVQQVVNDTDPLMWWKQHQEEFPRLARMTRQYLTVPASSASPERLFSSVGLVKSDLRGRLLDTTLIDVMWAKQAP
jgi:hypothetical protein